MAGVVFFDVDNVLIKGQSQSYLVRFLFKNKLIRPALFIKICFWFLLYKFHIVSDTDKIRNQAFLVFKGWDITFANSFFDNFYNKRLKSKVFKKSIEIIKNHQKNNDEIVLISASIAEIVIPFARDLGLQYIISTKLERSDGFYTGKIEGTVPYGLNKKIFAENLIKENGWENKETFAYSDHITDKELLEFVKHPYVVNPDKLLRKIAIKNSWPILLT